jgi:hypothetical protein
MAFLLFCWKSVSFRFAGSSVRFPGVLGFDKSFQIGQAGAPEAAVLLDPGINGAQRLRIELIDPAAAFAMLADQMSAAEQTQVLGNRGPRNGKGAGDLSRRLLAPAQKVEDGAPGRIGQSLEGGFGGAGRDPGGRICNRTVTHNA